jgi:hypothetical protein
MEWSNEMGRPMGTKIEMRREEDGRWREGEIRGSEMVHGEGWSYV